MPNQNLPYPPDLQAAIDRYRKWATTTDWLDEEDRLEEEAGAIDELDTACFTHSYDLSEVMRRERL